MAFHSAESNGAADRASGGSPSPNENFSFSDAYSDSKSKFETPVFNHSSKEKSTTISLPPLSQMEAKTNSSDYGDLLAPPLALKNHQQLESLSANLFNAGYDNRVSPASTLMSQRKEFDTPFMVQESDGVAGAIKRAQQNDTPALDLVEQVKSNKLDWEGNTQAPFAHLVKMRASRDSQAVPRELFQTSPSHNPRRSEVDVDESARINNIGIGKAEGLPMYKDQSKGRLPEMARIKEAQDGQSGFDQLNGSPEGYLFARKLALAKQFGGPDTKYTRIVDAKGTTEIQTANDFSTMQTSYAEDGVCNTSQYDGFRRPLLKIEEKYNMGAVEFNMTQYSYSSQGKVSPFPDRTREISFKDGAATVSTFDHSGAIVKLISSDSWNNA